jgi:hypothetical protein
MSDSHKKFIDALYRQVSQESRDLVREVINKIWTAKVREHYCCTASDGVKICHLEPNGCPSKTKRFGGGNCCNVIFENKHVKRWMDESKFAILSQELNFSCALVTLGKKNYAIYRNFDEKFGMLQWDVEIKSDEMWNECTPIAKALGLYYNFPLFLVVNNEKPEKNCSKIRNGPGSPEIFHQRKKPKNQKFNRRLSTWENSQLERRPGRPKKKS